MRAITYNRLGTLGRLGNQLWQIASTLGIASKHDLQPMFRRWSYAPYFSLPESLWVDQLPPNRLSAEDKRFVGYIADPHRWYLQDRALWSHMESDILDWFQPSDLALQILEMQNPVFFSVPKEDRIALHIRRGDAIGIPHLYPLQSPDYIKNALEVIGDGQVFIFTDDPNWCSNNLGFVEGFHVVGNADWADLLLMSLTSRQAIANSSFSYWGATISRNPNVCYPQKWYGPGFCDLNYKLMIPNGWIPIEDPRAGDVK